jgi:ATP-dependent exoDNAse (exonuclease V) alpha subunit
MLVTSHSSQGQTADRVWIDVDTELNAKHMVNKCMALRCSATWSV